MEGSELNRTPGKRGETGARARERVPSLLFFRWCFFFTPIFSPALLSERLEQTKRSAKPCLELCLRIVKFQNSIGDCISASFDRMGKMKNRFFCFCNKYSKTTSAGKVLITPYGIKTFHSNIP